MKSPIFNARKMQALVFAAALVFVAQAATILPATAATSVAGLPDFTDMVDKVGPAVVNIRTTEKVKSNAGGPGAGVDDEEMQEFFKRFFGVPVPPRQQQPDRPSRPKRPGVPQPDEEVSRGVGSGFIISADGYVMTNAHVVDGADEVYVTLTDKREFKAKIIGADKRTDVALVKIEGANLPRLAMGDSNKVRVGEWVIAIGSPFGLDNTVTAGIVSAKARDTGDYLPLIQTDVAVNPGNSGGPLINMRGEVIGINSQIYSRSGGYMGISFAVPIDEAMRVSDQLKQFGKVTRGRIGVQIGELTKEVAESLGLTKAQGALVQRVEAGGPAEKAGVEAGDIILKFNGTNIERSSDLPRLVGNTKPGSNSVLTVWRKGASRDLKVVIAEMEAEKVVKREEKKPKAEQAANALGLVVSELSDAQKKELKVDGGVVIDGAEGAAARAGLRAGDVVLRLNNTDVKDAKQFAVLVAKLDSKKLAVILVRRGDASQFVPIRPGAQ
ncbi:DegQ family serine endoprotease [Actimicrobium sp. CCC2.4]|uniref:DegQ family serine endoprotease n=1 Tax=Actimicrobium sp. CCC2.4 TaxID=3048606 RepID=UPI002AC9282B|nr:DegQ family serine endoprotease [Actimicrobium sp. CCC2.4]MEB0135568.1 DegQ family serine endoprotease [Actimicrobium sp. CCC2.4]WPX33868.1 DegQ family serine endoprotease [Actimicrobium sp. CCC2.4]